MRKTLLLLTPLLLLLPGTTEPYPFTAMYSARTQVQVSQSAGAAIGNMTAGAGLAAAFDGDTNETQATSAQGTVVGANTNTIGKDWGDGVFRIITGIRVIGPTDNAIANTGMEITLRGSTDNFVGSNVNLGTVGRTTGASNDIVQSFSGFTTSTAYRYHRIEIVETGAYADAVAELEFFEG